MLQYCDDVSFLVKIVSKFSSVVNKMLTYFVPYPRISTRQVALQSRKSKSNIVRILQKQIVVHTIFLHIKKTDFSPREGFCKFILLWSQEKLFIDNKMCPIGYFYSFMTIRVSDFTYPNSGVILHLVVCTYELS